ncbi:sensor histidine kinase [Halovulum sp. GXIMD14794]
MSRQWRPTLGLVLGGALLGTLGLSFAGLVALRYIGPEIGFRNAAILLAVVITGATAVLGWLLVRLLLRPIHALERYAAAQELTGEPEPPRHFGTRELHATAQRVIAMAEALRDREATIRAFTDHVTHEIRTPVSTVRAAVELLEDGDSLSDEDRRVVGQIDAARAQMEAQLDALRQSARARETRYLGTSTLGEVRPALVEQNPGLHLAVTGGAQRLPISAEGLDIILAHLLRNAAENGASSVTLAARGAEEGVTIDVSDDGKGISDGNAERIFDPFFTTRRGDGGTGMGLAVVRNILHAHRGEIAMRPTTSGAAFRISFATDPL